LFFCECRPHPLCLVLVVALRITAFWKHTQQVT
jgi:hypothetical protein